MGSAASRRVKLLAMVGPMKGPIAPQRPFDTTMPMLLLRAREAMIEPVRAALRLHGLTDQKWRVLRVLASADELEATQLARLVFLRPPSLTRIVRDLSARGYVSRRVDVNDRRVTILAIAPAGRTLIETVGPTIQQLGMDMRDAYGSERLEVLRGLLLELLGVMNDTSR